MGFLDLGWYSRLLEIIFTLSFKSDCLSCGLPGLQHARKTCCAGAEEVSWLSSSHYTYTVWLGLLSWASSASTCTLGWSQVSNYLCTEVHRCNSKYIYINVKVTFSDLHFIVDESQSLTQWIPHIKHYFCCVEPSVSAFFSSSYLISRRSTAYVYYAE